MFVSRSLVSWIFGRDTRRSGPLRRPGLECLEDRCVPAGLSVPVAHVYDLNGDLSDRMGGPTLVSDGGTLQAGRYVFGTNQGLRLSGALADPSSYSVVMRFEIDPNGPTYKRILDFSGRTSDFGLYVTGSRLQLYPGGPGTTDVAPDTDYVLTLTRDAASDETKVYLNGLLQATYTGGVAGVASPANNVLTFFEDDGPFEAVGGSVDYVATFDGVLSAADVAIVGGSVLAVHADQSIVTLPQGQVASITGTWSGNGIETVKLTASAGHVTCHDDGTWGWSGPASDGQMVMITATDGDGASVSTSFGLSVTNLPPSVAADGTTVTVAEGGTASMSGTWSDPGGDDVNLFASVGQVVRGANGAWSWSDVPKVSQTVTITATDSGGASSATSFDVSVTNLPPSVTATGDAVAVGEGVPASMSGTWSDPGGDDVSLASSIGQVVRNANGTWSWSGAASVSQTVTITATDSDGASSSATFYLSVANLPPKLSAAGGSVTVAEGSLASMSGTWSDPGGDAVSLASSAGQVVRNADGTWSWSGAVRVSQTVTITATDSDGASASVSFAVNVLSQAKPTMQVASNHPTLEAPSHGGHVKIAGTFADVGKVAKVSVDWGDGSNAEKLSVDQPASAFWGDHRYEHGGIYTVTVTLTDSKGATITRTTTAVVRGVGVVDGTLYVIGSPRPEDVRIDRVMQGGREFYRVEIVTGEGKHANSEVFTIRADGVRGVVVATSADDRLHLGKGVTVDVRTIPVSGASGHHGDGAQGFADFYRYLAGLLDALRRGGR